MRVILPLALLHQSAFPRIPLGFTRQLALGGLRPFTSFANGSASAGRCRPALKMSSALEGARSFAAASPAAPAMTAEQKYLFDLNGFIVIRGVLSSEEIAAAHAAMDAHAQEVR
jgi:hypothetical protein